MSTNDTIILRRPEGMSALEFWTQGHGNMSVRRLISDGQDRVLVGPALLYHGYTWSVFLITGQGKRGHITMVDLGSYYREPPQCSQDVPTVMWVRKIDSLTLEEARQCRDALAGPFDTGAIRVTKYDADLELAEAYVTHFPSAQSRRLLEQVRRAQELSYAPSWTRWRAAWPWPGAASSSRNRRND